VLWAREGLGLAGHVSFVQVVYDADLQDHDKLEYLNCITGAAASDPEFERIAIGISSQGVMLISGCWVDAGVASE
jgi:hypothetical protein